MLGVEGETVADVVRRVQAAGVPTGELEDGRAFVAPDVVAGVLGVDAALVFSGLGE